MAEWKVEVKGFKDVLKDDGVPMSLKADRMGDAILAAVGREGKLGEEASYAMDELRDLLEELADAAAMEDTEWFDAVLEQLYSWADGHRVWLG